MNVNDELLDFEAAGSLAEELPYWGWLDDERTCLTRAGELMSLARVSPFVLDGQTPEQLDRVIDRWQRMLSGLDARTRFYFYLLRRPIHFPEVADGGGVSNVVTLGQRKRRAFLTERVQDVSAYIAWTHDPGLSTVAAGRTGGPRWMAAAKNWMARRKNAQRSVYLHSSIEAAAAGFRQTVDASRALVDDLTPLRLLQAHEASAILSELTNRPGTPWDGATGSGMNWRLAVSELEAERRNLRLDGEPIVLYSLLSPPGSARANLLADLYRLDATLTVTLEWRPQRLDSARRKIRGAQRHYFSKRYSMSAHVQETEGSAAAMVDTAAAAESDRLGDALVELETDGVAYGDGAWGRYFDNPADGEDLQFQDWQVIDMAGAAEHDDLCEAALFYLLERLRLALENPDETARVKLMVVDEAWRYLQDPAVLSYLAEAAKTWRKKNAALIVATQSAVDVTGTAGAEALLESMPTKLFLANPDLPEKAAETFRLNPSEMNTIRGLIPKRELYLRRTDAAAILRLEVDPASYWLYTSSPVDAAKRAAAVEEHGLEEALEYLSKRR